MSPVLVDTVIWSLILRRPAPEPTALATVKQLAREGRVVMIGAIRQELLSGIRHATQYEKLRQRLRAYPDFTPSTEDYEQAAAFLNKCRQHGIQGSTVDFLICSVAANHDMTIYSIDKDFKQFQKQLPIQLLTP